MQLKRELPVEHKGISFEVFRCCKDAYVPSHKYRVLVRNAVISEIIVELKDEDNNHVDFNGIPWCIKLAISHVETKKIKPLLNGFLNGSQTRPPDANTIDEIGPPPRERPAQWSRPQKTKRPRRRKNKAAITTLAR